MRKTTISFILVIAGMLLLTALAGSCDSRGLNRPPLDAEFQSQLESLPTPAGVDAGLFARLKGELAGQLAARGKAASTPPTGTDNTPASLHFTDEGGGNYALHWEYRNIGDYDQNGTVGISDITPLAVHFGHSGADGLDAVIDGSGNNTVGIEDVTPIAQNFGVDCDYYAIEWSEAESGPVWTEFQVLATGDGTGAADGWLQFDHTAAYDPARWYRVTAHDSYDTPGQSSAAIQTGGGTGNPPVILEVSPTSGEEGASIQFSVDYTGDEPMEYQWNFGGGASPNDSIVAEPVVTLGIPGNYSAVVTLTNAHGSDTFDFPLEVTPAATAGVHQVAILTSFGGYLSFAFIDGMPALAYVDSNDGTLHYARATTALPQNAGDWVDMVVDESDTRWYDGELSLIADNYLTPIILAWDSMFGAAVFAGSNVITPDGAADWETSIVRIPVDEAGSLALAEGTVLATYRDLSGLHFVQADVYPPTNPMDWSQYDIDTSIGAGSYSRMKYNAEDGRLYVMAYNSSNGTLQMSHCLFAERATQASWTTFRASAGYGQDEGSFHDFAFYPAALSGNLFFIYYGESLTLGYPTATTGYEGAADASSFFYNSLEYVPDFFPGKFCSTAFGEQQVVIAYQDTALSGIVFSHKVYEPDQQQAGFADVNVPDSNLSPLTDTNLLVVDDTLALMAYGREDGVYFAAMPLD